MIRLKRLHKKFIDPSHAVDAKIDIPAPEGLKYLGYQKAGILFVLNALMPIKESHFVGGVLIADEMGL